MDLNQQQANLKGLLADVGGLVAQADQTAKSVNKSTSETIDRVFKWLIGLVVLLLVGIPLSAFANRWARRRQMTIQSAADR